MTEPFFLAIEGTDNSGKTSAATELTRHLVNRDCLRRCCGSPDPPR